MTWNACCSCVAVRLSKAPAGSPRVSGTLACPVSSSPLPCNCRANCTTCVSVSLDVPLALPFEMTWSLLDAHWGAVLSTRLLISTVPLPKPKEGPSLPFLLGLPFAGRAAPGLPGLVAFPLACREQDYSISTAKQPGSCKTMTPVRLA